MMNKIIIALDNKVEDGIRLVSRLNTPEMSEKIYGFKVGSLWLFEIGKEIINTLSDVKHQDHRIILDMQKWGTDIPDVVRKQVALTSTVPVDEIICCPMGAGMESLKAFVEEAIANDLKPICVLEMTQPRADEFLKYNSPTLILSEALLYGFRKFVIPATKPDKFKELFSSCGLYEFEKYATGFKTQGGQTKPMVDLGVTKFIVGRAVYEADDPIEAVNEIYDEINGVT